MKNLVKTIISLLLVSMHVFAFTACGSLQGAYDCLLVYGARLFRLDRLIK